MASGRGVRAGAGLPKQFRPVAGRPLLLHPLLALRPLVTGPILVALPFEHRAMFPDLLARHKVSADAVTAVPGGDERVDSVANGVSAALKARAFDALLVHDAARPFVAPEVVARLTAALESGADAAIPILPLHADETLVETDGDSLPRAYPRRDHLFRVQTPQAFRLAALADALARRDPSHPPTDESSLLFALGYRVTAVAGDERMMKVTTAADFETVASLLAPPGAL